MDPLDAIYEAILDGDGNLVEEHTRAALDSGQSADAILKQALIPPPP